MSFIYNRNFGLVFTVVCYFVLFMYSFVTNESLVYFYYAFFFACKKLLYFKKRIFIAFIVNDDYHYVD